MKLNVLDKNGKKVETVDVDDSVFGATPNESLLGQYIRVFRANQRQGTSSAKTRAEVSGGGKKPWRQKGTGRARHGSTRSPLWRTGGVTHGPRPKSWNLKISKKLKQKAVVSALSSKKNNDQIVVLNEIKMDSPKTKEIAELLKTLELPRKTLIVLPQNDISVRKSISNLDMTTLVVVDTLNAYDLLNADSVIFVKEAVLKVNEKYKK